MSRWQGASSGLVQIALKGINHFGEEALKIYEVK